MSGFCYDAATFKFVLLPSVADHCDDDRNLLPDIQSINIHLLIQICSRILFLNIVFSFIHLFFILLFFLRRKGRTISRPDTGRP